MTDAATLAQEFWWRMGTNEWSLVAELFAPDIEIVWPQSGEIIGSAEDFVAINAHYPAEGKWAFDVQRIVGAGSKAVTETRVTDGNVTAMAISVFECSDDRIDRITEYWPEPFDPPQWRKQWVTLGPTA